MADLAPAADGGFGLPRRHDPTEEAGMRETLLAPLEAAADPSASASPRSLFFGLVNRWEASLRRELDAEFSRGAR